LTEAGHLIYKWYQVVPLVYKREAIRMKNTESQALLLIKEAEEALEKARSLLEGRVPAMTEPEVGARVLAEIIERGGSVSRGELYEIAANIGMDKRGLGGLFRQTGKTLLHVLPGDRVVLTPEGAERGERYNSIYRRTKLVYESTEPNLALAAEPSFAEDWNSDEDAAYDNL
jgi:hypothetical protein